MNQKKSSAKTSFNNTSKIPTRKNKVPKKNVNSTRDQETNDDSM